jgi:glucan phosphoethanolaminetransferase (alkaline phosphatase superfamily)
MWQRIQTVFLALVVVSMIASIFLPIWVFQDPATGVKHELYPLHYTVKEEAERTTLYFPYSITAILMVAAATIAVMEIRRFDNRITQIKMGTLNSLVLMGVMIAAVVFSNKLAGQFNYGWRYGLTIWTAFAGVAFNWLALRFIRRDEKLVRDSERLR